MKEVQDRLFALSDEKYRDFLAKLIPNVDRENIMGVRTPALRAFAKEFKKEPAAADFISELPHRYLDEYGLHSFLLEGVRDLDTALYEVGRLLEYVDNWATCDGLSPRAFQRDPEPLLPHIYGWLGSGHTYKIRFGIKCLMNYFLGERFCHDYPEAVAAVQSGEYYVNMMRAWYFATAMAKQYEAILPYIEDDRLDTWTHNKTIQKAVESYRITDEQKAYLKTLKRKA